MVVVLLVKPQIYKESIRIKKTTTEPGNYVRAPHIALGLFEHGLHTVYCIIAMYTTIDFSYDVTPSVMSVFSRGGRGSRRKSSCLFCELHSNICDTPLVYWHHTKKKIEEDFTQLRKRLRIYWPSDSSSSESIELSLSTSMATLSLWHFILWSVHLSELCHNFITVPTCILPLLSCYRSKDIVCWLKNIGDVEQFVLVSDFALYPCLNHLDRVQDTVVCWQADYNEALLQSHFIRNILHWRLKQLHHVIELTFQHITSPKNVPFHQTCLNVYLLPRRSWDMQLWSLFGVIWSIVHHNPHSQWQEW